MIVIASRYGFSRRAIVDELAIQSAHTGFVPRVGGLAIFISILGIIPLVSFGFIPLSVMLELNAGQLTGLILSAIPVFTIGLAEDLGYSMSPRIRLFSAALSSFLAISILHVWISNVGIPGVDDLLFIVPIGILFTAFATVGVVNAFNLIDGLNGLSSYVATSTAIAISIIGFKVGDIQMVVFSTLIVSSVLGFMVLNFPLAKIFMGDGGAYAIGHLLVWSAILLIDNAEEVSPFAILLIFFWPVADTGLAIWRRWKLGNPTDRPDRLHFHQLTMRFLEIRFFGRVNRQLANPIATLMLIPFITVPQIVGVLYWNQLETTVWLTLLIGLLFITTYIAGISFAKSSRGG